jgi:hypothetical protein
LLASVRGLEASAIAADHERRAGKCRYAATGGDVDKRAKLLREPSALFLIEIMSWRKSYEMLCKYRLLGAIRANDCTVRDGWYGIFQI